MRRREFMTLLGAVAWPLAARVQPLERARRIGYLTPGQPVPHVTASFVEALRELGWLEGRNLILEFRSGENDPDRLARVAAELVRLDVDLIVAHGTLGPLAAKRATTTIPIVALTAGDPLGSGLVVSLARPGGNVTGNSLMAADVGGKRLEILKEILPALSRVSVLWNAANPYSALVLRETESAGRELGIEVLSIGVRNLGDLDSRFEEVDPQAGGAVIVVEDPLTVNARQQIADFAAKNQLPGIYGLREFVEAGGLIAYGAQLADLARRGAAYVDKILRGAKPADLPVQQPTKFELLINLRSAKKLGLEIPPTLLARADEVIE